MAIININPYSKIGSPTPNGVWTTTSTIGIPNPYSADIQINTDSTIGRHTFTYTVTEGLCTDAKNYTVIVPRLETLYDRCEASKRIEFPGTNNFIDTIGSNIKECNGVNRLTTSPVPVPNEWLASNPVLTGDLWYKFTVPAGVDDVIQIVLEGYTNGTSVPIMQNPYLALYKNNCNNLQLISADASNFGVLAEVTFNPAIHGVTNNLSNSFWIRLDSAIQNRGLYKLTITYNIL